MIELSVLFEDFGLNISEEDSSLNASWTSPFEFRSWTNQFAPQFDPLNRASQLNYLV